MVINQEMDQSKRAALAGFVGLVGGALLAPSGRQVEVVPEVVIENPEAKERGEEYDKFLVDVRRFTNAEMLVYVPLPAASDLVPGRTFLHFDDRNAKGTTRTITRGLYIPRGGVPNPTETLPTIKYEKYTTVVDGMPEWYIAISGYVGSDGRLGTLHFTDAKTTVHNQTSQDYHALDRDEMIRLAGPFAKAPGFMDADNWTDWPTTKDVYPNLRTPLGVTKATEFQGYKFSVLMQETGQVQLTISPAEGKTPVIPSRMQV